MITWLFWAASRSTVFATGAAGTFLLERSAELADDAYDCLKGEQPT